MVKKIWAGGALAVGLLLLPLAAMAADAEFIASVDRDRITLDDTITLTVTFAANGEADELRLPEAPDFDVISQGRSTQLAMSFGSGGRGLRREQTHTLLLRPRKEGKLAILPGEARFDGQRYQTARLTVEVLPSRGGSAPSARAPDAVERQLDGSAPSKDRDLFLRAIVDKEEVWLGEQVTMSLYLFSRMDVAQVQGLKMPGLDGFWAEELHRPRQISAETRMVDGVPYRAYLVQRRALFPLRAGTLEIAPAELDVIVGGGLFSRGRKYRRVSEPTTIEVKSLPSGAPANFASGNVGDYTLEATLEPATATVGEAIKLRLEARGEGNLGNLELPTLPRIDGLKAFDPTRDLQASPRGDRYGGTKSAEWILVADRAGEYALPPFELAIFDPDRGAYRIVRSEPLRLSISGAVASLPASGQQDVGLKELSGLHVERSRRPFHESPFFFGALLLPALAVALVYAGPRLSIPRGNRRKGRRRPDLRRADDGFAACEAALLQWAGEKLGEKVGGLSRDELRRRLLQTDAAASADTLVELLALCETARWAPDALPEGARETLLAKTEELLG